MWPKGTPVVLSTGQAWTETDLSYAVFVDEHEFLGAVNTAIKSYFYGNNHEAIGITVRRGDLSAAFLGIRANR